MTRALLDEELLPLVDIDDLHDADLDAEIRRRIPELPSGTHHQH